MQFWSSRGEEVGNSRCEFLNERPTSCCVDVWLSFEVFFFHAALVGKGNGNLAHIEMESRQCIVLGKPLHGFGCVAGDPWRGDEYAAVRQAGLLLIYTR